MGYNILTRNSEKKETSFIKFINYIGQFISSNDRLKHLNMEGMGLCNYLLDISE